MNQRRGMALHVVMALVAVLMLIATSMVALSSMNLNLATAYTNGQVALNEAEAGVSKLMYVLNDNPQYGFPGSSSTSPAPTPPDVEIHGRLTSGFTDGECFHWVTFRRDRGVPWSVNNYDGSWTQGYGGRTVPKGKINAFSTGYCRGQYRTIELVVEHPPFPYALATSGKIQSATSLIVQGTASSSAFGAGDTARPGHVVSNFVSADPTIASIGIGTSGSTPTNITGFVQACGAVRIAQPAVVRGGIFANAAALRLPVVDVRTYKNQGQEGVSTIYSETLGAQTLDTMYYCGHNLTVDGGITLKNGFLYVDGGLTVTNGGIKGVGAIVVDGDVLVQGDESFSASHRVALLASGDVNLQGNGNYLQGLVYAGGSVSAKKLTVLGNVVVNNPDPTKGATNLDQVRIVSNPETASFSFTAKSSQGGSVIKFPILNNLRYPPEERLQDLDLKTYSVGDMMSTYGTSEHFHNGTFAFTNTEWYGGNWTFLRSKLKNNNPFYKAVVDSSQKLQNIASKYDPHTTGQTEMNKLYAEYLIALEAFFTALHDYSNVTPSPGTQVFTKKYTFDVNTFLPLGEGMKVVLWHVHHVPP